MREMGKWGQTFTINKLGKLECWRDEGKDD